jgi:hypothetical protein
MIRTIAAVVLASASLTAVPPAGAQEPDPGAYAYSEEYFPSFDGTILHAYLYRPATAVASGERTPVVLAVTPYAGWAGNPLGPDPLNMDAPGTGTALIAAGYSRAVVELRGTGASGGCEDLFGPREAQDAKAAVEHYADAPWSTGRVGMVGSSYDGFTQIAAIATHARGLAAVVAGAPPVGYHNFYHHRVRETGGGHGFGALYLVSDIYPAGVFAPPEQNVNSVTGGTIGYPACYAEPTVGPLIDDPDAPYWVARDLARGAAGADVPTIWRQGFNDWQVRPNGFMRIFPTLRGPKVGIFGPWDHSPPRNGSVFDEMTMRWLDRFVKDVPAPDEPDAMVQSFDGTWRTEAAWPPADATPFALPLKPGMYLDVPGNNGESGFPAAFNTQPPQPLPAGNGTWTFTQSLPYDVHVAGVGTVTPHVDALVPGVHVVAIVYDVDEQGNARMVTRGVARADASGDVPVELYPQDWRFPAGHRVGVLVSGADDVFFEPPVTLSPVTVTAGSYAMPFLLYTRRPNMSEGPFNPRRAHAPFVVDSATIESSTVDSPLPPPMSDAP